MTKIKCPVCGCFESANAEICRACGTELHDRPQEKIVTKAKCTACGCFESADTEACRACGAALQSVPVRETSFAQVVGGFFSWMKEGFHGIDKDSPLYVDIDDDPAFADVPGNSFYYVMHSDDD